MNIGELNQRIAIQTHTETPTGGSSGSDITQTNTTLLTVWAKVEPVSGLTMFDTQTIGKGITHKITTRFITTPAITSENWILYRNKRFRIRSVRNLDETFRYLELMCEEIGSA